MNIASVNNSPLKTIRIKNFKSLRDTGNIKITNTTLLFGKNGAGKSSLLSALSLLSQIVSSSEDERENLSFNLNSNSNFGSYNQLVKDGDESKCISMELLFNVSPNNLRIDVGPDESRLDIEHQLYNLVTNIKVNLEFALNTDDHTKISLHNWSIKDLKSGFFFESNENKTGKERYKLKFGKFAKETTKNKSPISDITFLKSLPKVKLNQYEDFLNSMFSSYTLVRNIFLETGIDSYRVDLSESHSISQNEKDDIIEKARIYYEEFIEENKLFSEVNEGSEIKYEKNHDYDHDFSVDALLYPYIELVFHLLQETRKFVHIRHLRNEFPRALLLGESKNTKWENELIEDLIELFSRSSGPRERLKEILQRLELCEDINIEEHSGVFQLFVIQDGKTVNIADTSSGFKQVLPIIIKLVRIPSTGFNLTGRSYFGNKYLLLIEQPELHLHPKLQSDLLKEIVLANTHTNLIIETHNENLLRKLQILIAKNKINAEDTAVYFFDKVNSNVVVKEITIDKNGFIYDTLPKGFLDESYLLTEELLLAARNN